MVETGVSRGVRAALVPMGGALLLVPAALVAEVTAYREPEPPVAAAPGWLLGTLSWRGLGLPVVALGRAVAPGAPPPEGDAAPRRLVVLYGLHEQSVPFYGVVAVANPRLVEVAEGDLQGEAADGPYTVMAAALGDGRRALVPDLGHLERELADCCGRVG